MAYRFVGKPEPAPAPAPVAEPTAEPTYRYAPPALTADPPAPAPLEPMAEPAYRYVAPPPGMGKIHPPTKDFVDVQSDGSVRFVNKLTGAVTPKAQGKFKSEAEAQAALDAGPEGISTPAAPLPPKPTPAPLPPKSTLDQAVGSTARAVGSTAFEYTKGLLGPVKRTLVDLPTQILDPLVALVQAEFGGPSIESLKGTPHEVRDPFYDIYQGLAKTVMEHPTDLLGGAAHRARTEGTEVLKDPSWYGEATTDALLNLTLLPLVSAAGRAGRAALPARAQGVVDRGIAQVIPRAQWKPNMLGAEAANEGRKKLASIGLEQTLQSVKGLPGMTGLPPAQQARMDAAVIKIHQNSVDLANVGAATPQQLGRRIEPILLDQTLTPQQKIGRILDTQIQLKNNAKLLDEMGNMNGWDQRPLTFMGTGSSTRPPQVPLDYVQVGNQADLLGLWKGAWVHPDVVDVLPTLNRSGEMEGFLRRYIQMWKASKTVYNPGTHLNNVLGNVMFSHLAGANPFNPLNRRYYSRATAELQDYMLKRNASPMLEEAMKDGAVRPGFVHTELNTALAKAGQNTKTDVFSRAGARAKELYDAEDLVFRYAAYLKNRDRGLLGRAAATEVNKYFPSYSSTSPVGRFLRGPLGGPFTSFPLESARIYTTAAKEVPHRVAAVGALGQATMALNLADLGMTLEDWHEFRQRLPDYERSKSLRPFKGPQGDMEVADWSNIVPLSDIGAIGDSMADTGPGRNMLVGGPLWNAFKLYINHDWGMGRPVVDPTKGESDWKDWAREAFELLAPLPSAVTNLPKRLGASLNERPPRRSAELEEPGAAALRSLFPSMGAKTGDELEVSGRKQGKAGISELKRGKRGINRNPTLSDEDKERRRQNIIDEIRERKR